MTDLHARFREVDTLPVPDLWQEASSRPPGPLPPSGGGRRAVAAIVAIVVAAAGLVVARGLLDQRDDTAPAASPTPSLSPSARPPEHPGTPIRYEFVPQTVVDASASRLVVEAPAGIARWTLESRTCDVRGYSIALGRETGGMGGGCSGTAYLTASGGGGLAVDDRFFMVIVGRALPEEGHRVRVVLRDGRTVDVAPVHGLWMVVLGPVSDAPGAIPESGSRPRRAELLDPNGDVVATEEFPEWPY